MTSVANKQAPGSTVEPLVRGIGVEIALLEDLTIALLAQRAAVARDDVATLDSVLQQIGRTILSLRETRRERSRLAETVAGRNDPPLADIAADLPLAEGSRLRVACRALHDAARATNRELGVNQAILRRAIEAGEGHLQQILSAPADGGAWRSRRARPRTCRR